MRFGVFYEHQLPRPWGDDGEHRLLHDALAQIEIADRVGFDTVWEVEHHFLEEYSHSSAPEVFLGAATQRTRRIRLGHGIIQLPTNHPIRVAERVATLDLLSGGRVELGLGEGQGPIELHPFGRRVRDKREVWEEAVRVLIPCFTQDAVEFHGQFFDFPARNVIPKPRQKPHPPLWVACSNITPIASAGQWGMGALGFQFVSPEAARAWVNRYYISLTREPNRLADYPANPNIAMVSAFMCAPTDGEALARAEGSSFFQFALGYYATHAPGVPGEIRLWDEYLEFRDTPAGQKQRVGGLIGSPDTIRERLRRFEESNVDQVILLNQAGKNTHEDICSSLELFAREVMPEFHDREPEHQAWKQAVLAGDLELEELDTEPFATPRRGR